MIRLVCLFLTVGLAAGIARADDKVPLKLELPPPLFSGTPRPLDISNLEKPIIGRPPPFLVPIGTRLLSQGKPVTSSDSSLVVGDLSMVTDGDKGGEEGSYVELGPGLQWVQIDLRTPARIAAIAVWHYHSQARVYHDVIVQVSDDPSFKQRVQTLFNNDYNSSSGLGEGPDPSYIETYRGRIIDGRGAVARYVRLYSKGNTSDDMNHYCEVEVYGQPVK